MKMTGAQAVVRALELEGVKTVFGYPGGAILPVYDSLRDSKIHHVLVRHEQGAAFGACGYAKSTGKVGVCIATSGPGATNLITGVATAYMDSIPLVAITGQVAVGLIGRDVFQEVDITGATAPFCKHNYLIKNVKDIPRVIKEAFHIASSGRPGPVLIDLPKDVAQSTIDFSYPTSVDLKGYKPNYEGHPMQIRRVEKAIKECKKPLICIGGGVIAANASKEVLELAERIQAPVAVTLMGLGAFPANNDLYLGLLGMHGNRAANKAVEEADLFLILGARMGDRAINRKEFGRSAVTIHIDIDPAEIGKNVTTDIPIVGDIKMTLGELLKLSLDKKDGSWFERVSDSDKQGDENIISPSEVLKELNIKADKDMIVVTDVGQHQMFAGQNYKVEKPRTFITSGGLGTMGFGLPAAIGAKIANPDKDVLLITGDGSFQMSLNEMATAMQEELNIKILMLNNNCLGMVRELQQQFCDSRYFSVHMKGNPDFIKLAGAYGIEGFRVDDKNQVSQGIDRLLSSKGMIIGEFIVNSVENVTPDREG